MFETLVRNWWAVALRGVLAILFGLVALMWPGATLASLILIFGAFVLVEGAFTVAWALFGPRVGSFPWGAFLGGLVGIAIGVLTFMKPNISALVLLYWIAWWAILKGIFEIVTAIQLRKVVQNEWMLALSGVIGIAFGIFLLARPGQGAVAILSVIGV
ncbi:MAG TPA: HdeD family acid-resistance protein, partial [Acidobacteriota bacterium]|nr:HdeD family acid-resistance protein [Acidobacteriota bacterium]